MSGRRKLKEELKQLTKCNRTEETLPSTAIQSITDKKTKNNYFETLSKLVAKLEAHEKQIKAGKKAGYPRVNRNSQESARIFNKMTENEFISILGEYTTEQKYVKCTQQEWTFN